VSFSFLVGLDLAVGLGHDDLLTAIETAFRAYPMKQHAITAIPALDQIRRDEFHINRLATSRTGLRRPKLGNGHIINLSSKS